MGEFSDAQAAAVESFADRLGAELRATCLAYATKPALEIFDHVYEQPHSGIAREREEYRAYLAGFDDAEAQ